MAKLRKVEDDVLLDRLTRTFKDVGYEGASLAAISEATGLKKSSLYHRFPGGKEQMAQEVLSEVATALDAGLFPILEGDAAPDRKMEGFVTVMDGVYAGGRESCLLNMLSPPRDDDDSRGGMIADIFRRLLDGLSGVALQAGATAEQARLRAEEILVTVQGSLVVARGMDDPAIFKRALDWLPAILLGRHACEAPAKAR